MNLEKLFKLQKELDDHIEKIHPRQEGEDRLAKKILALQVELAECAQESRCFKFWSKDQEPNIRYCHACNGQGYFDTGLIEDGMPYTEGCGYCEGTGIEENPLLEEYVDCLHFILSIGLEIGYHDTFYLKVQYPEQGKRTNELITERFNDCFRFANIMSEDDYFNELVQYFMDLGYLLGFTWEQIETAYLEKNKVNHARQESGY